MKNRIKAYIRTNLGIDDEAVLEQLYDGFREIVQENLSKLEDGLNKEYWQSLQRAALSLRGCAANIGAEEFRRISHDIEAAVKANDLVRCKALIDDIRAYHDKL